MADYQSDVTTIAPTSLEADGFSANNYWWFGPTLLPSLEAEVISIVTYDWSNDPWAPALSNPSFESPANVLLPDDRLPASWTFGGLGQSEAMRFESERRWAEDYFGGDWANEAVVSALTATNTYPAVFGTSTRESYESGWFAWTPLEELDQYHLSAAVFNSTDDDKEDYEREAYCRHVVADNWPVPSSFLAATSTEVCDRLNILRAAHDLHVVSTVYHVAPDTSHVTTVPAATDLASAETLIRALWQNLQAHLLDGALEWHLQDTHGSIPSLTEPANLGSWGDMLGAVYGLTIYIAHHFTWASNSGPAYHDHWPTVPTTILEYVGVPAEFERPSGGNRSWEGYEDGWRDNQDAIDAFSPSDLSAVLFENYFGNEAFDSHETEYPGFFSTTDGEAGPIYSIDASDGTRVAFTGTFQNGLVMEVQTRRKGSGTFVTRATVNSSPEVVDLDKGNDGVRFRTVTWGAGSNPLPYYRWRPMLTM